MAGRPYSIVFKTAGDGAWYLPGRHGVATVGPDGLRIRAREPVHVPLATIKRLGRPGPPRGRRLLIEHASGELDLVVARVRFLGYALVADRDAIGELHAELQALLPAGEFSAAAIETLEASGLVTRPYATAARPRAVTIAKPVHVKGNVSARTPRAITDVDTDAPVLLLFKLGAYWHVVLEEGYAPGPGPRDFDHAWPTEEEAVRDVLQYYFGER